MALDLLRLLVLFAGAGAFVAFWYYLFSRIGPF